MKNIETQIVFTLTDKIKDLNESESFLLSMHGKPIELLMNQDLSFDELANAYYEQVKNANLSDLLIDLGMLICNNFIKAHENES